MKKCATCNEIIENDALVVCLLMCRYQSKEGNAYDLQPTKQTILAHVVCPEKK